MNHSTLGTQQAHKVPPAPIDLSAFFDLSPDLFCVIGVQGDLQRINLAVEAILGWSPGELLGTFWMELVHPEDMAVTLSTIQHCHPEHPCNLFCRWRHKNGSYRWLSWSLSRSVQGLIYAIARNEIDPDEKLVSTLSKKLENLKKERKSLYRLLDQLPVFLHIRAQNSVGFYNKRFREIFGEPHAKPCFALNGEIVSTPSHNHSSDKLAIAPEKNCSLCPTCHVLATNTPQTWEWLDRRTGHTYEIYNYPFKDVNGELKIVEMGLDITERKQQRLWNVLDLILNEIYIFDAETLRFQYVNARARGNLGYSMEEMRNLSACDIKPEMSEADFRYAIAPLLSGGRDKLEYQTVHQRQDGSSYPVEVHLQLLEDNGYRVLLAVILDITERLKVEADLRSKEALLQQKAMQLETSLYELQQTQAQLIQIEKMSSLGQLVAGVAHEINNPVNFIHGNLPYIKEYSQDLLDLLLLYQAHYPNPPLEIEEKIEDSDLEFVIKDFPQILDSLRIGTERIREIVLSLRNFSRHDEAEMKAVDIHTGIDSTMMILQYRLKPRPNHPEIKVIKQYGDLPLIECYAGQLNQVFMNILANAIEALETHMGHCEISISTSIQQPDGENALEAPYAVIRIADNGPGMPEHVRNHLFEPFFTTKPIGKGTGLGLWISYSIVVEKHRGKLYCISKYGHGTEFIIEIPIRQS